MMLLNLNNCISHINMSVLMRGLLEIRGDIVLVRQYIKERLTKWGMKFWVLADSINGYTYDFDLYLWKQDAISTFGLEYTVIMKLGEYFVQPGL